MTQTCAEYFRSGLGAYPEGQLHAVRPWRQDKYQPDLRAGIRMMIEEKTRTKDAGAWRALVVRDLGSRGQGIHISYLSQEPRVLAVHGACDEDLTWSIRSDAACRQVYTVARAPTPNALQLQTARPKAPAAQGTS